MEKGHIYHQVTYLIRLFIEYGRDSYYNGHLLIYEIHLWRIKIYWNRWRQIRYNIQLTVNNKNNNNNNYTLTLLEYSLATPQV